MGYGGGNSVGSTGGNDNVTLTVPNLPEHSHDKGTLNGVTNTAGSHFHWLKIDDANGGVNYPYNIPEGFNSEQDHQIPTEPAGDHSHTVTISGSTGNTGSGQSFDNRPRYYVLAFIIRTQ